MASETTPYWETVAGPTLAQGDFLARCPIPVFPPAFGISSFDLPITDRDAIVVTQSCDLANQKIETVALCPVHSLAEFENRNPDFRKKGVWESVRQGRREGLHLLGSWEEPTNNRKAVVVDFRHLFSLPHAFLTTHASGLGPRWRLRSPYLEHFSQAFARFFMRVGLPAQIPRYD